MLTGIKIVKLFKKLLPIIYKGKKKYIINQNLEDQQFIKNQKKERPSKLKRVNSRTLNF